jgi:hypothetical protein
VVGDALDPSTFAPAVTPADTIVHLVGTPHPSPSKAAEFRRVDLPSILASVEAARRAQAAHLVYVSVAHPAPVMHAYIEARSTRDTARRLGLVTLRQMVTALVRAVENPPAIGSIRIVDVPGIRRG